MSTLYAFSVGPIPTEQGPFDAWFGLYQGRLLSAGSVRDAETALGRLADQVPLRTDLRCTVELAVAGAPHGFRAGLLSEEARAARLTLALTLAEGPSGAMLSGLPALAEACAAFWNSRAWERLPADQALYLSASGGVEGTWECAIMGAAGEQFGLALYPGAGSVARIGKLIDREDWRRLRQIDSISVTLDDEPAFALGPVRDWCGLEKVPTVIALAGGAPRSLTDADALALTGALLAASRFEMADLELELTFSEPEVDFTLSLVRPARWSSKGRG